MHQMHPAAQRGAVAESVLVVNRFDLPSHAVPICVLEAVEAACVLEKTDVRGAIAVNGQRRRVGTVTYTDRLNLPIIPVPSSVSQIPSASVARLILVEDAWITGWIQGWDSPKPCSLVTISEIH